MIQKLPFSRKRISVIEHKLNSEHEQVKNWLTGASKEETAAYWFAIKEISQRTGEYFQANTSRLPNSRNRMVTQMSTGHHIVWADLLDYRSYFNVFYVGNLDLDA